MITIWNDAALFLFFGWKLRHAIHTERIQAKVLGLTRQRRAANGELLKHEVALGLVMRNLALKGRENPVASANGVVGARIGFKNNGVHGDALLLGAEVLDDLQDVADAEEFVGIEKIFLLMGREIYGERTIRGASSALVFTCGASLRSGGAVVVASPAVHPFLEVDFYSLREYRPFLRAKVSGFWVNQQIGGDWGRKERRDYRRGLERDGEKGNVTDMGFCLSNWIYVLEINQGRVSYVFFYF